jgi:hypothetical protein
MAQQRLSHHWREAEDAQLRRMWISGMAVGCISLRLTRPKPSVYGRARKLRLPKRPSTRNSADRAQAAVN